MTLATRLLCAAGVLTLLSGCSYINTFTGETNNKVLPGTREDAIPGRSSFPDKPDPNVGTASRTSTTTGTQSGCTADDPGCQPPATTNDTFSDPQ